MAQLSLVTWPGNNMVSCRPLGEKVPAPPYSAEYMAARKSSSFHTQTASSAVLSEHSARSHNIESHYPAQSTVVLTCLVLSLILCGPCACSSSQPKHSNTHNKIVAERRIMKCWQKQLHVISLSQCRVECRLSFLEPYNG